MPEESPNINIKETAEAVGAILDKVPIYPDAIQPAAKEIGKTLGGMLRVAFLPFNLLVWGFDNIKNYLEPALTIKLSSVPIENLINPAIEIAGPAIEALRFSGGNIELRELYANIIATSMDERTAATAHPSFVEILKNISSDECLLLKKISDIAIDRFTIASVDFIARQANASSYSPQYQNYSILNQVPINTPKLVKNYIDNLCRLGIIEVRVNSVPNEDEYLELEESNFWDTIKEEFKLMVGDEYFLYDFSFRRKIIWITNFGKQFCEAVVQEKS